MKLIDLRKSWFVVRTFSGEERDAAEELRIAGFDAYCPTKRVEVDHHRTKAKIIKEETLLKGYLFAAQPGWSKKYGKHLVDFEAMTKPRQVIGVLRPSKGEPYTPVPAKLVEAFQIAEMNMEFDETTAADIARGIERKTAEQELLDRFPVGSEAIIDYGPFKDFNALITKHLKLGRVKVEVHLLGRRMEVESDIDKLRTAA